MPHQKADPIKHCEICGELLTRKRFASGRLEDRNVFLKRTRCSQACANSRLVVQRNTHGWRARRAIPVENCEECGTTEKLHVHHKDRNPAINDPVNLAVLCASCHLKLHWREDREYRVQRIRESVGASMNRRYAAGKEYLEGPHPRRLNRIKTETQD